MIINFDEMSGREKELYEKMWSDYDFSCMDAEIIRTNGSKNSYCFDGEPGKTQTLIRAFDIKNKDLFSNRYDMAISGSGDEEQKIATLRSSSLCALLHFYNVTEENPLILELDTDKHKRTVKFTESFFEYKSRVIKNPSNMDVVLLGKDKDNEQDIILFLESKFSEHYIYASNALGRISKQYLKEDRPSAPLYEDEILTELGLRRENEDDKYFRLETLDERKVYIDGIKQMISHFTGVMNDVDGKLFRGKKPQEHKTVDKAIKNREAVLMLGEIVFDGRIAELEGKNYSKKYHKLALKIAELTKGNSRFEIITDELGYSLFKDNEHVIEPKVRAFYRY